MTYMCTYFNTKTNVAQNLIDYFFSEKTEVLYTELNKRAEAATGSYSGTGDSLQYIHSVPVSKNYRNIRSRCLVHEFYFTDIFLTLLIMVTEQLY